MSTETRAPFRKIVGKTYPIVGEIVVRRMHGKQLYGIDGTRYTTPQVEVRLIITIERGGEAVGWAQVAMPPDLDAESGPSSG